MNDVRCYKHGGRAFFQRKYIPRKATVRRRIGVKRNTFAGDMVSRVYDYYFRGAINFKTEYRKYYRKEFGSLKDFIEERFNIEHEEAVRLAKGDYSMKECSRKSIERNIETLNYDENFKAAFSKVVGGLRDEDSDGIYF